MELLQDSATPPTRFEAIEVPAPSLEVRSHPPRTKFLNPNQSSPRFHLGGLWVLASLGSEGILRIPSSPPEEAHNSVARPSKFRRLGLTSFRSSNIITIPTCPRREAHDSGAIPTDCGLSGLTSFRSSNILTTDSCPKMRAIISGGSTLDIRFFEIDVVPVKQYLYDTLMPPLGSSQERCDTVPIRFVGIDVVLHQEHPYTLMPKGGKRKDRGVQSRLPSLLGYPPKDGKKRKRRQCCQTIPA